ncbi:hypothetical protein CJF32_00010271 [Rutstroemia sp. NJR-2017a WRK4]|nr:hypothetical protein CJF32_00010271 [Rutstroemia sp. NJR-2017a WRK4]
MPHKIRRTKGVHTPEPKTPRTEHECCVLYAIAVLGAVGTSQHRTAEILDIDQSVVSRRLTELRARAERNNRPLLAVENVHRTPRKRGAKPMFTGIQKRDIYEQVIQDRANRHKTAEQHIYELHLNCSESNFKSIIYEYSQHFLPGAEKPQLTRQIRQIRVQLAVYLLKYDLKTIVFIDQANARTEYGKERCWHDPDEYFDSDVVQQSTKQSYQKAEFMATIKWGEPPGPYIVLKKETLEEENAAEAIMQKYRAD